jgi:hypothetical protein
LPQSSSETPPQHYDANAPALHPGPPGNWTGSGIEPHRHPDTDAKAFGHLVRNAICGHCRSHRVLVIYMSWSVHPYSGDAYWNFDARCTDCGWFSHYAGAED